MDKTDYMVREEFQLAIIFGIVFCVTDCYTDHERSIDLFEGDTKVALEQNTEKMEMGFKIEIFWWIWLNFRIFFTSKIRLLNNIDLTNFQKTALERLVY